ncbi:MULTISPECIES: ferritin-like domain-containing protein [unclassified Siphonobacter]|uniref:ferritin-like domain-containing protein n=1 Tax=unclassified Siphonobacter TaxID=2635712 RepID=UPI002781DE8C|nr:MULTISPECIES: ferritin-like domain-containing protein [unclassified Siphonobacter]MDQ1086713.1 hypothetical protein [Siphonobacter sp. SORGH_AS_1065]MDR6196975.1 hypothetical protein [Siphonobacter sp. SORGH_AS_0500]
MSIFSSDTPTSGDLIGSKSSVGRRTFLRFAGISSVSAMALTTLACEDHRPTPLNGAVDLGAGDVGIMNLAYSQEQLEVAFYSQVVQTPYANISSEELAFFTDLRDRERTHLELFKYLLGDKAIPMLTPNFSSVDFSSRESVLKTGHTFEDLGVAALNGAGRFVTDMELLALSGKIVSVEARHAALLRDLLHPKSQAMGFAGDDIITTDTGLDRAFLPPQVVMMAQPFIQQKISAERLPKA